MPGFAERVSVIIDVAADKAVASVRNFRTAVSEAHGVVGKFKAGASAAMQAVRDNAKTLALVGGAALLRFAVKGVEAYTKLAKASRDLSKSTGLSLEQASRWIAVADDFEVEAKSLALGLGKIAKTLNDTKWERYGISVRDAGGESRAVNDILLDSLAMLSSITNETDRARVGQELFGKSYQALAPIIGHTREEYEDMLGAVTDGQVITSEEAAKAERLRLANDALADAFLEVQLAIGGVVAAGRPLINVLGKSIQVAADLVAMATGQDAKSMSGPVEQFSKALEGAEGDTVATLNALSDLQVEAGKSRSSMDKAGKMVSWYFGELADQGTEASIRLDDLRKAFGSLLEESPQGALAAADALKVLSDAAASGNTDAQHHMERWGLTAEIVDEFGVAARDAARDAGVLSGEVETLTEAFDTLLGRLDAEDAYENALDAFDNVTNAAGAMFEELANGNVVSEQTSRDYEQAVRDLQREMFTYAEAVGGIPEMKMTMIQTAIESGDLETAKWILDGLTADRVVNVKVKTEMQKVWSAFTDWGSKRAIGGTAQGPTMVGEHGPEIVDLPMGANVTNAADTRRTMSQPSSYIDRRTFNLYVPAATPDTLAAALDKFNRRNGL